MDQEIFRRSMASRSRPRHGERGLGLLCWLSVVSVTPLLFVPGAKKVMRTKATSLYAADDEEVSSAQVAKLKAELELAQARAAAAEAKAALAAAKAEGEDTLAEVVEVVDVGDTARAEEAEGAEGEGAEVELDLSPYSENELRPAKLFYGPEGSQVFEVLEKMEDVKELDSTSLDAVLRAWFMSLYQFSAASQADLPPDAPADFRRNVKEVGSALKPDEIASFLMDRDKGGDWRPCLRALAETDFANIMDQSLSWGVIFTNDVVAAANITMEEGRRRIISFLAAEPFKQVGSWSDAEADAAERLIARDPRLQRVFSRMNLVKNSIGENIRSASLAPILAIVFFVAAVCCFCNGLSLTSQPPDFQQELPLMGLEKK